MQKEEQPKSEASKVVDKAAEEPKTPEPILETKLDVVDKAKLASAQYHASAIKV